MVRAIAKAAGTFGLAGGLLLSAGASALATNNNLVFSMVRSASAAACLPHAAGRVTITSAGTTEHLHAEFSGLPPTTDFDLFVIQVPNGPFGLAVYEGDVLTDLNGFGVTDITGRFNIGSFVVAPGSAPAPDIFKSPPFPDATTNPKTAPVQLYHLGLWFDSAGAAAQVGCPTSTTPFNSTHNAGIQVLNTANFPELAGPLLRAP